MSTEATTAERLWTLVWGDKSANNIPSGGVNEILDNWSKLGLEGSPVVTAQDKEPKRQDHRPEPDQMIGELEIVRTASRDETLSALATESAAALAAEVAPEPPPPTPRPVVRSDGIDQEGQDRSLADRAAAESKGFAVAETVFQRGRPVNQTGVRNAQASRRAYEQTPTTAAALATFRETIEDERRSDIQVRLGQVRMTERGSIAILDESGRASVVYGLEREALGQLAQKAGMPIGAGTYLAGINQKLRAINVNHWCQGGVVDEDGTPRTAVLRTRHTPQGRQIFAAVSKNYTRFDADRVVLAMALATEHLSGAKMAVSYDGRRVKAEVFFQTTVAPKKFVAGEFYRAGIVARSSDDGTGGIAISGFLLQNLCLNLIIVQRAEVRLASVKHMGSAEAIADEIRDGIVKAEETIEPFLRKWGYAQETLATDGIKEDLWTGRPVREVFASLFAGAWERDLVPVSGRREQIETKAWRAFQEDSSSESYLRTGEITRAGFVNSLTRIAHTVCDEWEGADLERSAAQLIWDDKPLPYRSLKPRELERLND